MVSDKNTVSVIVPLYNKEKYVHEAIQSALDQSYKDIEIIVVDDGSTDHSAEIVDSFKDGRIRLIRQNNQGVSCARNSGVLASTGKLIAFLDADDFWFRDHLLHLIRLSQKFPSAAVYCNQFSHGRNKVVRDSSSEEIEYTEEASYVTAALNNGVRVWTSALMLHRHIFNKAGGFPAGISHGEDLSLWLKATFQAPVAFSSYVGAVYRKNEDGLSAGLVQYPDGSILAIDEILTTRKLDSALAMKYKELRANFALAHVITAYQHGRNDVACKFLAEAHGTKRFKNKYRLLKVMSFFPEKLNRLLARAYKQISFVIRAKQNVGS